MENLALILVATIGFVLGVPFIILGLARIDAFFTIIEEGTAKVVVLNGKFYTCKMRYSGFYLDDRSEVKKQADGSLQERGMQAWIRSHFTGGLAWVGVWPFYKAYKYDFRWTTLKRGLREGKAIKEIDPREEEIDYIFVRAATYFIKLEEAETKGKIPITTEFIITIRITNPRKALFRVHQWFEFVTNTLLPHLRAFQGSRVFDELNQMKQYKTEELYSYLEWANPTEEQLYKIREGLTKEGKSAEEIKKELEERSFGVIGLLRERYGIDIIAVGIESLEPANAEYQEALAKQELATLEANRIKTINKMIAKYGPQALEIRRLEALESVGKGANNTILLGTGEKGNVSLLIPGGK